MGNPFHRANRRSVRRFSKYHKVTLITDLGQERDIQAFFMNPSETAQMSRKGTNKGGQDFRQSAKRLRVMAEDVEGISSDWEFVVNGARYFPADHKLDGEGSMLIFLSAQQESAGSDDDEWL